MTDNHRGPINDVLERWHPMVASLDFSALAVLLHPEAVFRSPVAHTPYTGSFALALALQTVIQVFEDFTYHRTFISDDGYHAVLEFSARVNGKALKGVDMISVDGDGRITEFEVMIRPKSGLDALAQEMGERIGAQMTAMKANP